MEPKRYVEIDGKYWEVNLPWCCGCPEFIIRAGCGYEGNGCRFPESRKNRPISFQAAYSEIVKRLGKSWESYADELGDCITKQPLNKEEGKWIFQ